MLTQMMSVGVYDVPRVRFKGVTVLTNNTTVGAYRGAGRPEATQLIERVLDITAAKIGMDPTEIRRKNFLDPAAFPLTTITGPTTTRASAKALDAVLAGRLLRLRRAGGPPCRRRLKQLGIGMSSYVGAAPVGLHIVQRRRGAEDGTASLSSAPAPRPGHRPSPCWRARCSDPVENKARQLRHRAATPAPWVALPPDRRQRGAHRLQRFSTRPSRSPPTCSGIGRRLVGDGGLQVAGVPAKAMTWGELAIASQDASKLPPGMEPGALRHELDFDGTDSTYPFGAHVSVVEVDMETGGVRMLRHIAVDDCGRILNPLLVAGQQHGGIAQGAAQALFEWVQYDEDGNPSRPTCSTTRCRRPPSCPASR
jgi:carbon-monoxide dehydrogenase large subunit